MNQHALKLSYKTDASSREMDTLIDEVVVNPQFIVMINKYIKEQPYFLTHLAEKLATNEKLFISLLPYLNKFEFERMMPQFFDVYGDNADVVLCTVKKFGIALKKASDNLKNNAELVKYAIKNDIGAFEYASKNLRGNKEFVWSLDIDNKSLSIVSKYLADNLKNDKDFMMLLLKKNAFCYMDVSDELKYDIEILCNAVSELFASQVLSVAPHSIKNNKEVMLTLIGVNPHCYYYISAHLKDDLDIVYATLKGDITLYDKVNQKIKDMIGDNDPLQYLSALILKNEMEISLDKHDGIKVPRVKI